MAATKGTCSRLCTPHRKVKACQDWKPYFPLFEEGTVITTTTTSGVTYTLKDLWNKACEFDRIEPSSLFVVFSTDNPWAKKHNTLVLLRQQASC